jgi:aspartyl-tRNA(Asn)/glutamyl-tRNA(Gln) amidotransferase subunit C
MPVGEVKSAILLEMANLTRDDVLKLARLARIELSDAEVEEFTQEFSEILRYVELLQDVDVNGLEPTSQVTGLTNVTRIDAVKEHGSAALLLDNVPQVEADQIKVQRMIV